MKILIIDDDETIRDLFRLWLEREGFEVYEADNGLKGVEIQRKNRANVLICDLIMPVQEGIETIAQFREEFPETVIIAISGGGKIGSESYLTVAQYLGAWKVFNKPVDMAALIETIRQLTNSAGFHNHS